MNSKLKKIFLFVVLAAITGWGGCQGENEGCEDAICLNGSGCLYGDCLCADGFTGTNCQTPCSLGYQGPFCNTTTVSLYQKCYTGHDVIVNISGPTIQYEYTCCILPSDLGLEYFVIQGFGGFGGASPECPTNLFTVACRLVSNTNFVIDEQTPPECNVTIKMSANSIGFRNPTTGVITFRYHSSVPYSIPGVTYEWDTDAVLTP